MSEVRPRSSDFTLFMTYAVCQSIVQYDGVKTHLLDSAHKIMLISLTQLLNLANKLLIPLTLNRNRQRQPTQPQRRSNIVILRHGL